ncbi:MAG: hypothetical protein SCH66_02050 [Methanolobus sp.]|nr:hypothetical protein [Methanolobus sp.]
MYWLVLALYSSRVVGYEDDVVYPLSTPREEVMLPEMEILDVTGIFNIMTGAINTWKY